MTESRQGNGRALDVVASVADARARVAGWRRDGDSVGLVPTMGALHDGHMALVAAARAECDRVVVSIFVNPMQFNRQGDLETYPRDEAADHLLLRAQSVDLIYAPTPEVMYPPGFASRVSVAGLDDCLCGRTRPGHLTGVCTVVAKLLTQTQPNRAYFGEKDYQQLLVIQRMVRDLDLPPLIRPVPTVRAADGLALSSRNANLDASQRAKAARLYQVLGEVEQRGRLDPPKDSRQVPLYNGDSAAAWRSALAWGRDALLQAGFEKIDYLELRHAETLESLQMAAPPARLFVAAWLGATRLIDNLAIDPRRPK